MASKFRNGGQTCVCANCIYIQDGIYDKFAARLAEVMDALRIGDGLDDADDIGPTINDAALAKIETHVSYVVEKGPKFLLGVTVLPTVLDITNQQSSLVRPMRCFSPLRKFLDP